jgi:hypothetical protein
MTYTVRVCPKCPYSPSDLGLHYDPYAPRPCCITCEPKNTTAWFPRRPSRAPAHRMPRYGHQTELACAERVP